MAHAQASSLWMIRTIRNQLLGPFTKEEICRAVREGRLGPDDEVCRANQYWFSLNDRVEVPLQLGIQALGNKGVPEEDEITQTETETDLVEVADAEFPEIDDSIGEATAILSNRALREFRSDRNAPTTVVSSSAAQAASATAKPAAVLGVNQLGALQPPRQSSTPMFQEWPQPPLVERPSVWRGLASALFVIIAVLLVMVMRILKA